MPGFRVSAKCFSLTYPRCNLSTADAIDKLVESHGDAQYIAVSKETHEDGGYHLHAMILFENKKNIKNQKFFDIDNYHPNIQATRNIEKWVEYIQKEGTWLIKPYRV